MRRGFHSDSHGAPHRCAEGAVAGMAGPTVVGSEPDPSGRGASDPSSVKAVRQRTALASLAVAAISPTIGVSSANLPRIFAMFSRVCASTRGIPSLASKPWAIID